MAKEGPDVFHYLDYRRFLGEFYEYQKGRGRGFSYRSFARKAGFKSPNYLKLVIEGKRNLTPEMAASFASACGLSGKASEFFQDLVQFNQAKNTELRNNHYKRLNTFRAYRRSHRLELAQRRYHEQWFIPVVREFVGNVAFRNDAAWIAEQLVPKVRPQQVESAIDTLKELGLLMENEETGEIRQTDAIVSTGPELTSVHLVNFHRAMLKKASESLDRIPHLERDISSVTIQVAHSKIAELKSRIQQFRAELLELGDQCGPDERVMQINLQLFPLTARLAPEKKKK